MKFTFQEHVPKMVDNMNTDLMAANPILRARTKHIELDLFFVRDKILKKHVQIKHVPATAQITNVLQRLSITQDSLSFVPNSQYKIL